MSGSWFIPEIEPIEPYSILSQDGQTRGSFGMSISDVKSALRFMVLTRVFDDKGIAMQRQGRFGTFSSVRGQEASVVGASFALDPKRDWLAPQYRELPALLRHGYPLEN